MLYSKMILKYLATSTVWRYIRTPLSLFSHPLSPTLFFSFSPSQFSPLPFYPSSISLSLSRYTDRSSSFLCSATSIHLQWTKTSGIYSSSFFSSNSERETFNTLNYFRIACLENVIHHYYIKKEKKKFFHLFLV